MEVDSFDAVGNAGQHFVGNGLELVGEDSDGQVLAEDFYGVALLAGDAGDIDHSDVHADVSYVVGLLSVDETVSAAVAQVTVESVGIAYGDGCDERVATEYGAARIADALASCHMAQLEDGGFQRGDVVDDGIVARIDAIESQSEPAHVELSLGEVLNAGGVADVAEDFVRERLLQLCAGLVEELELTGGEIVEVVAVGTHKMAEHGARDDGVLPLESGDELCHVFTRIEAQTAHAGVELDVDGPAGDALALGGADERFEQTEGVDFGLEVVVEDGFEGRHLGVHHHDGLGDAVAAQLGALVGHSHSEVVDAMVLQGLCNLYGSGSVAVGLNHADKLGVGTQERTVIVEIVDHGTKIDLERGLVNALDKHLGQLVETKLTGTFYQDDLVVQGAEHLTTGKLSHAGIEIFFGYLDALGLSRNSLADTNELLDAPLFAEFRHFTIELFVGHSALLDVAQDEGLARTAECARSAAHEVECDVERMNVGVIGIVDERQTILSFLHLEAHGHWLELTHALGKHVGGHAKMQGHDGADNGVVD